MDNDTKNFFEKLASGGNSEVDLELDSKTKTKGRKKNNNKEEITAPEEERDITDIFEETEGQLTIDVYQTPTNIVVESAIAGVKPEDIDVSISADSVTVRGKREKEETVKGADYLYQECYWGRFARSVVLPQEIDPDRAQASLKNGVLKIVLPKVDKQKQKKIKIKTE